jgi:hypothetical protein
MSKVSLIGWKISSPAISVASVRYRCLLPVLALRTSGVESRVFSKAPHHLPDGLACLIFVKSFKSEDYVLALQASQRSIPVVMDICDNIFVNGYGRKLPNGPTTSLDSVFLQMAGLATMIVVPTEPLAEIVRRDVTSSCPVVVIPDGIVTKPRLAQMISLLERVQHEERINGLQRLRATACWLRDRLLLLKTVEPRNLIVSFVIQLARKAHRTRDGILQILGRVLIERHEIPRHVPSRVRMDALRKTGLHSIVWFGHHGANYARFGMLDLLAIRSDLEYVSRQTPIELVVVSNSRKKFDQYIRLFELPTRYVEWSLEALETELSHAAAVIIPNSLDDFSVSKSPNRAVLALLSGVPVVATATPALMELKTCIVLNDFVEGLKAYISDPERRLADVKEGQSLIQKLYGDDRIRESWLRVIEFSSRRKSAHYSSNSPVLLVVLHNQLDWQLLGPVVREALAQGLPVGAVLDGRLSDEVVILSRLLGQHGVGVQVFHPDRLTNVSLPTSVRALVCATESNLLPHRLAHQIALHARRNGIYTAVLQHGYEAPGLTYHDSLQSIRKVSFASERIYLWGTVLSLHPLVPESTRAKCLTVGFPDARRVARKVKTGETKTCVVGVFENLHWQRYTKNYRSLFISGLRNLAKCYPGVSYIIRSHPQGRWLQRNNAKLLLELPNVTFAPETGSVEEALCVLFESVDCVITTPSTVALLAAQVGLPVAVVDGGLGLTRYQPLALLSNRHDWVEFMKRVEDSAESDSLIKISSDFVSRVIQPGNAAHAIISDIRAHI